MLLRVVVCLGVVSLMPFTDGAAQASPIQVQSRSLIHVSNPNTGASGTSGGMNAGDTLGLTSALLSDGSKVSASVADGLLVASANIKSTPSEEKFNYGFAEVGFIDTLTLVSPTLAPGTLVDFSVLLDLSSSLVEIGRAHV